MSKVVAYMSEPITDRPKPTKAEVVLIDLALWCEHNWGQRGIVFTKDPPSSCSAPEYILGKLTEAGFGDVAEQVRKLRRDKHEADAAEEQRKAAAKAERAKRAAEKRRGKT